VKYLTDPILDVSTNLVLDRLKRPLYAMPDYLLPEVRICAVLMS